MSRIPYTQYPTGVISPLRAHAHPYPTRYHGGRWGRPVFGFPWKSNPVNRIQPVFMHYEESDMRGLGDPALDINTGDGVFMRPTGRPEFGGGVFDGNYPMSGLGVLTDNPLGALGVIPSNCWGVDAFEKCKAQRWEEARGMCDSSYGGDITAAGNAYGRSFSSTGDCIDAWATKLAEQQCLQYCPGGSNVGGGTKLASYVPGQACAADGTIRYVQMELGVKSDGTWGDLSRAALAKSGKAYTDFAPGCAPPVPNGGCSAWSGMTTADCNVASGRPSALIRKLQSQLGVKQTGVLDKATCIAWHQKIPKCGTLSPCPLNLVNIQDTVSGACKPRLCEPYSAYPFPKAPCDAPGSCAADEQLVDGICTKKPDTGTKQGSMMMWWGLAALGVAGLAYAASQSGKKKTRRRSRAA